jgi:hypothetical protein
MGISLKRDPQQGLACRPQAGTADQSGVAIVGRNGAAVAKQVEGWIARIGPGPMSITASRLGTVRLPARSVPRGPRCPIAVADGLALSARWHALPASDRRQETPAMPDAVRMLRRDDNAPAPVAARATA